MGRRRRLNAERARAVTAPPPDPEPAAETARRRHTWRDVWPALLSLVLLQAAVSFWGAAKVEFVGNYDTAWYYTVARNISQGKIDSDDVLWHWLGAPETVARPAGDYWGAGWPYLLGGLMAIFGNSMKASVWICAALSLSLPLLTFWLALLIQGRITPAWFAGLIVIPQERLIPTDFTPDIALPTQIMVLLGLCLFVNALRKPARSWETWCVAGFVLAVPLWLRSDAFVVGAAAAAATLIRRSVQIRTRLEQAGWLLAGASAGVILLLAYNIWAFGAATPPPRAMVPWMVTFRDLYRFDTDPSFASFNAQGASFLLRQIRDTLSTRVEQLPVELPLPLLVLGALGCYTRGSGKDRDGSTFVIPCLIGLFCVVPAVLAPRVSYNPGRFTQLTVPLACALAASALGRLTARWESRRWIPIGVSAVLAFSCIVWFWPLEICNPLDPTRWLDSFAPLPEYLAPGAHPPLGPDDVVMSTDPWEVAAVLGVPAIMVPIDSAEAMRKVAFKYHARYLLVVKKSTWYSVAQTAGARALKRQFPKRLLRATRDAVWFELPRG